MTWCSTGQLRLPIEGRLRKPRRREQRADDAEAEVPKAAATDAEAHDPHCAKKISRTGRKSEETSMQNIKSIMDILKTTRHHVAKNHCYIPILTFLQLSHVGKKLN